MSEQNNNPIRKSIDNIEPAEGARERMLRNIKQKAAEHQTVQIEDTKSKKTISFSRIMKWTVPLAACLVLTVVGISVIPKLNVPIEPDDSIAQIGSPFGEEMTVEEMNNRLGITLKLPPDAQEAVCVIMDGTIGDISFSYNNAYFSIRVSKQSGDFSGLNGTLIKSEKIDSATNATLETIRGTEYNYLKMVWTDGEVTYILSNDSETTADTIKEIYNLIK